MGCPGSAEVLADNLDTRLIKDLKTTICWCAELGYILLL